jgi:hypothetical protein
MLLAAIARDGNKNCDEGAASERLLDSHLRDRRIYRREFVNPALTAMLKEPRQCGAFAFQAEAKSTLEKLMYFNTESCFLAMYWIANASDEGARLFEHCRTPTYGIDESTEGSSSIPPLQNALQGAASPQCSNLIIRKKCGGRSAVRSYKLRTRLKGLIVRTTHRVKK